MTPDRIRLLALIAVVLMIVAIVVPRQLDQAEQAAEQHAGKTVIVHYLGLPQVATTPAQQIDMAIYKQFLDKPENRDVRVEGFSGLQIHDLPAAWDAMMQMAFAADRAPDIMQLVTESIQTHREEEFVRPLPDYFTYEYSNAAWDDVSGYRPAAVRRFREVVAEQRAAYLRQREAARKLDRFTEGGQWLEAAALACDSAVMRQIQAMADQRIAGGEEPHLAELLDVWNDLMHRSGQDQRATATAPDGERASRRLTPQQAWHRWLFEKLQAKVPADLLRALYDLETGKLYGADEGIASLMGLKYRLKPYREAHLTDRSGRPILPQTWDELEFWSVAISLIGEAATTEGIVGYKLAHGRLSPWPFPLYSYGCGGRLVEANPLGGWSCALDSPGTIRGMAWLGHIAFLRPIKIDYDPDGEGEAEPVPLVLMYHGKDRSTAVPDFYLRCEGPARQVVIRRLTLTDNWRVMDLGQELFRFDSRQSLVERMWSLASKSNGQCEPTRPMDEAGPAEQQMWEEDRLAMQFSVASSLVVANPQAEGQTRHPDGAVWDAMVSESDLADPAALAALGQKLSDAGIAVDLSVSEAEWRDIDAFLRKQADVLEGEARSRLAGDAPARLARMMDELAAARLPIGYYASVRSLKPARPTWAESYDEDIDRAGRWTWVHLVGPPHDRVLPDRHTVVTVNRMYVVQRDEFEAWPGGPRFTDAPAIVGDGRYAQFVCGLQAPADGVRRRTTWRLQVAVVNMGMLSLNHRLTGETEENRKKLDAAVRLISYLSSDEAERIMVEKTIENGLGTTLSPVVLRKYGYDYIADQIPREYEEQMRQIRKVGRAVPAIPNYRGFQQFLASLVDRVAIEGDKPADACKLVTATVNKRFLSEPDPEVKARRRSVARIVFGCVLLALAIIVFWMGKQLVRGAAAAAGGTDAELGSVGQRTTWKTHLGAWVFLGPAVLTIFVWHYIPLGWGSVMAFQDFHIVKETSFIGLDNFIRIFVDPEFYKVLGNTLYYVGLSLGLGFLAPVILALMLHEIPWGKIFFRTVFYLPAITSGLVILFMWKKFYDPSKTGLLNTLLTQMNDLGPVTVFALKLAAILAVPAFILALFNMPLADDIETRIGRFIAALPPVLATLWLGSYATGNLLPPGLADRLGGAAWAGISAGAWVHLAAAAVVLVAGLAMLRAAFACEHEFATRRIPWAAPGIVLIFAAGWLGRLGLSAADASQAVPPTDFMSHAAQLFVLLMPLVGAWPILRRLLGKEHTPRETMYLVLRAKEGKDAGDVFNYSRPARRAALTLGGLIVVVALAGWLAGDSPVRLAWHYLLAHAPAFRGWLLQPFTFEPLLWLKDRNLAMLCIILPGVWAHMGPGCLIYLAGLKSIPDEVYEAADLDGAGAMQKAWTITVPHLMALLVIQFVGAFIGAFQASQNVLVMTAGGPADATMVLGLRVWLDAFVLLKFGYATALAWILALILIAFTMYQISILKKVQFKTSGMK